MCKKRRSRPCRNNDRVSCRAIPFFPAPTKSFIGTSFGPPQEETHAWHLTGIRIAVATILVIVGTTIAPPPKCKAVHPAKVQAYVATATSVAVPPVKVIQRGSNLRSARAVLPRVPGPQLNLTLCILLKCCISSPRTAASALISPAALRLCRRRKAFHPGGGRRRSLPDCIACGTVL